MATAQLTAQVSMKGAQKAKQDLDKFSTSAKKAETNVVSFGSKTQAVSKNVGQAIATIDGPLGGISSRISSVTQLLTTGGVAATAFGVAIAGIGSALVVGVRNLDEYEVNLKRVEATLKATGDAVGFTAIGLREQADALALATLTSTQEVQKAQAQLLTFNRVLGQEFSQAISLSQDLAEAGFGSITTNAVQLGKALQDPIAGISALSRVGVTFNDVQKEQIELALEAGQVFEAQAVILQALEDQVGGVAAAVADGTLSGGLDTLGQRFTEFSLAVAETSGALSVSQVVVGGWIKIVEASTAALTDTTTAATAFDAALSKLWEIGEAEAYLETLDQSTAAYRVQVGIVSRLKQEREDLLSQSKQIAEAEQAARKAAGDAQQREIDKRKQIETDEKTRQDALRTEREAKEQAVIDRKLQRETEAFQQSLDKVTQSAADENQILLDKVLGQELILSEALDRRLIGEDEFRATSGALWDEYYNTQNEKVRKAAETQRKEEESLARDRQRLARQTQRDQEDALDNTTSALKNTVGEQSSIYKAAAITQATIDTYKAANAAFSALAGIPIVGPALGAAAAGVAIGAGLANVQQISSVREQGGAVGRGDNVLVGERGPEVIQMGSAGRVRTANQISSDMSGGNQASNVNITVIDQSDGQKDFTTDTDANGDTVLLIRNIVSGDIADSNSQISKSLGANTSATRSR